MHNKALQEAEMNIINLTKSISVAEAKAQKAREAQRLEPSMYDEEASLSSLLPSPPLDHT